MATEKLFNDPGTTLSAGIDNSVTTVPVTSAAVYGSTGNFRIRIDSEVMLVTAISSNNLTVTRGIEGTTAASHLIGAIVRCVLTAGSLSQYVTENAPIVSYGTYASRPGSPITNQFYQCTDIPVNLIYSGSVWKAFYHGIPVTLPADTTFTANCSFTYTTNGIITLSPPADYTNNYGMDTPISATPYTIRAGFSSSAVGGTYAGGITVRDSSGTSMVAFSRLMAGDGFQAAHWSAYAPAAGGVQDTTVVLPQCLSANLFFLQLYDNGTNFTVGIGTDPSNIVTVYSASRTAHLSSPGYVGFLGMGSALTRVTLFDWTVS